MNTSSSLLNKKRNNVPPQQHQQPHLTKRTSTPNRKRSLKSLLEFYLSDSNLINSKHLSSLLLSSSHSSSSAQGIPVSTFLTFNKVKTLLNDIKSPSQKRNLLIRACDSSRKIYYSQNKIYRFKPFNPSTINYDYINSCTVYIENLPSMTTHEILFDIFSNYKINYISLPKYANGVIKGFAFVTFDNVDDVDNVIQHVHNSIPKQLCEIGAKELVPLNVMSKEKWMEMKKEFKELKRKLKGLSEEEEKGSDDKDGWGLVKMKGVCGDSYEDVKVLCLNFVEPIFVDVDKEKDVTVLRFESDTKAELFVKMFQDSGRKENVEVEVMQGEEKERYVSKVVKLKEEFKERKKEKEKKKKGS